MQLSGKMLRALAASLVASAAASGHPVEKVIEMLQGLASKVKEEAATEEVTYAKFEHWCTNSKKTLREAIENEKAAISSLEDAVAAKTARSGVLAKQIEALEGQIGKIEAAGSKADKIREGEAGVYSQASADFVSTIQAIKDAITALQGSKPSELLAERQHLRQVLALIESEANAAEVATLQGFLSDEPRPDLKAAGDRDAHVQDYKFKSGGVIEMLKGLLTKFEDEQLAAEQAETNAINAHSLSSDARTNAKTAASDSKGEKELEKGSVDSELVTDKADLEETQSDLDADTGALSNTDKQCALKASEWAERSNVRKGELEAMKAGIAILAKVAGVRTEAPSNPIPPASPVAPSFLQVADAGPKERAVQLLRKEAKEAHSRSLERLAQEIQAHASGPFDEVNNMIQKMIHRLMSEQTDEDNHKNWCDQELSKTNATKVNKEDKAAALDAKLAVDTATVGALTGEIASNAAMLASIEQHVEEATEIRQTGKHENEVSIKDAQEAQQAIADAVAVLEQFYKTSGMMAKEAYEFVQATPLSETPSTWDSSYTGVADPTKQPEGIISVLKKVAADFDKMEADTRAQEETDDSQYKEDMKQCEIEKARRTQESNMKSQEKKRLNDKIASATKVRKQVGSDLEAVEQYLKDLQPACVQGDSTYEDRKAARGKEIDALHEAQGILASAFDDKAAEPKDGSFLAPVNVRA